MRPVVEDEGRLRVVPSVPMSAFGVATAGAVILGRLARVRDAFTFSGRLVVKPADQGAELVDAAQLAASGVRWSEIDSQCASILLEPDLRARQAAHRRVASLLGGRSALREATARDPRVHRNPRRWSPREGEPAPAPNAPCPCGSGRRYRKCCQPR
ncbi:MAG: SEC-C domain-containing protein [Deltaproteobacteria bacterium]|nr:SEC-C domain-containing protein [Deltaproteobacteria bacterium]